MPIRGHDLIAWGFQPGPIFKDALARAAELEKLGWDVEAIKVKVLKLKPVPPAILKRHARGSYALAIEAASAEEEANLAAVRAHMNELMKTPVLEHGVVMPDACPSGNAPGTIPVGGAVVSRAIHPAFHSSDICCSMHVSLYEAGPGTAVFMDAVQASTRFGAGRRAPEAQIPDPITDEIEGSRNPFLKGLAGRARAQLADQGDGNHFAYLGELAVTPALVARLAEVGQQSLADALRGRQRIVALVTHHGSRDLGAQVYKRGLEAQRPPGWLRRRVREPQPAHRPTLRPDCECRQHAA
jgi:tRNA-splicing ligase RtcB